MADMAAQMAAYQVRLVASRKLNRERRAARHERLVADVNARLSPRMNRGGHDRGPQQTEDVGVDCPHCPGTYRNLESHITKSHPEVREAEVDQN